NYYCSSYTRSHTFIF
nr:immunoglobulin light chain junction region [Macaca mulatta]MOW17087.1 immunoglobulin light chain junction region [Macaca mulatta]MOW17197.1 immunoglobulin light chain junction region [Macaca mulatta]MOW18081.1 immunoglobulin light chain junction region [Macaca mulatta]